MVNTVPIDLLGPYLDKLRADRDDYARSVGNAIKEYIDGLKMRLAALDWSEITAQNPVVMGDEVLDSGSMCLALVIEENLSTDWTGCGFDYRRPINAPSPKEAA